MPPANTFSLNAVKSSCSIGLVGDYSPKVRAHRAIPRALELAARSLGQAVRVVWLDTALLADDLQILPAPHDALWCVPGSPYANMQGALAAIRFARERPLPFLGTCGGFQHALIEYARNVLGWTEADHAESNPAAALPLVAPLSCSLVGVEGSVRLLPGSEARRIYGRSEALERYHCNFGLNGRYQRSLQVGALRISGVDEQDAARVIELHGHPFFMATLFQPELSALSDLTHPIISAFVAAALAQFAKRVAAPAAIVD
jgi:CTP synthase (UTP-ammonia lyase)